MNQNVKVDRYRLLFLGFLSIYAIIMIVLCKELNIWEDEAYSLYTSSNSLPMVLKQSYHFEGQPPVYFILLSLWRTISQSIFFARLFSIICIGLAAYYIYKINIAGSGKDYQRWTVIIFLLNPFSVWAALEIRTYALLILLSTLSIYYFLQFYTTDNKKYLYFFLIACLIGLYTQYFFAFLIAALAITFLFFKGWKSFLTLCLYLVPIVILFLPNLFFVFDQVSVHSSNRIEYSSLQQFVTIISSPITMILGLEFAPFDWIFRWTVKIASLAFVFYMYFVFLKQRRSINPTLYDSIYLISVQISILIFLFCFGTLSLKIMYQYKYMAILLPLLILMVNIFRIYSSSSRSITFISLCIYFFILQSFHYSSLVKKQDYKAAANFVKHIEHSNEPIIFYSKSLLPPFSYYYAGNNMLVPIVPMNFNKDYYENDIKDTSEIVKLIENVNSPSKDYILVNDTIRGAKYAPKFTNKMFDQCLESNFKIEVDTIIPGNRKDYYLRIRRIHKSR